MTTTVTATYLTPENEPCTGRVVFRLVAATYQDGLDAIFPTVPVTAVLDGNGEISIELEPTSGDDAAFDSDTMTYQVDERINQAERAPYYVDIPTAASVDLGTLVTYADPPWVARQLVTPDLTDLGYVTNEDVQVVFTPEAYGAQRNGTHDDTAAVLAAVTACEATGGVLEFAAGTYRIDGRLVVPNDGQAAYPRQRGMIWRGAGSYSDPKGGSGPYADLTDIGGTILDLRYTGGGSGLSKIWTGGKGRLEITGITFTDQGTSSNPFLKTTNTDIRVHGCAFVGNPTKDGTDCDQDAIILGGLDVSVDGGNGEDSAFQGYGTVIRENHFARIRRAVKWGKYANACVVRDNNVWISCGSNLADGGAFDMDPGSGSGGSVFGNVITGNLVEVAYYPYGIRVDYAQSNTIAFNNFYDPGVTTLGYVGFISTGNAKYNLVIHGFGDSAKTHVVQVGATVLDYNTVLDTVAATGTTNYLSKIQAAGGLLVRPSGGGSGVSQEFASAADGAASTRVRFSNYGKTWGFPGDTGADMLWDTGTGGSYANVRAFGWKLLTHTGTLRAIIGDGIDGIKLGSSSDVWFSRHAAAIGKVLTSASVYAGFRMLYAGIMGNSAPSSGDIDNGQATIWFDSTNGAPKLMVKAKQADGTVVTGSVTLA